MSHNGFVIGNLKQNLHLIFCNPTQPEALHIIGDSLERVVVRSHFVAAMQEAAISTSCQNWIMAVKWTGSVSGLVWGLSLCGLVWGLSLCKNRIYRQIKLRYWKQIWLFFSLPSSLLLFMTCKFDLRVHAVLLQICYQFLRCICPNNR